MECSWRPPLALRGGCRPLRSAGREQAYATQLLLASWKATASAGGRCNPQLSSPVRPAPPPCPSAFPARSCVGHCSPLNDCAVELKEGDLVKM